ncbi:hypothetical protein SESBI_20634 [Sesbania bispinosa]|nr:hypothetical protein SESBI_20634 [Sesbania bispinosa]
MGSLLIGSRRHKENRAHAVIGGERSPYLNLDPVHSIRSRWKMIKNNTATNSPKHVY